MHIIVMDVTLINVNISIYTHTIEMRVHIFQRSLIFKMHIEVFFSFIIILNGKYW